MAADAAYLQQVSQLLNSTSTPHLILQGSPASPALVKACLEAVDELASDLCWEDLLWVQGLADSFAWCRAHCEGEMPPDERQVRAWLESSSLACTGHHVLPMQRDTAQEMLLSLMCPGASSISTGSHEA